MNSRLEAAAPAPEPAGAGGGSLPQPGAAVRAPETPQYGLIFIHWNTPELAAAAVRSALDALEDRPAQILVVDNGSRPEALERLRAGVPPAVEVLPLGENRGYAAAANRGLERITAPYGFLLNTDVAFRGPVFRILSDVLEREPRAALAVPKLLRPDGSLQPAAVPEPSLFWELTNRALPRHFLRLDPLRPTSVPSVVGPCMAVHMERIRQVGGLDERFFFFFEETDWCRRLRRAGFEILYVPAAEVVHLQGKSANTRPIRARIQFYDSRYRYFRKHHGITAERLLAAGLWLRLTLDWGLHSLLGLLPGARRHRDRAAVYAALWRWHARGRPPGHGFEPPSR